MKTFFLALIYFQALVMCSFSHAELTIPPKNVEAQFTQELNFKNPGFETGLSTWNECAGSGAAPTTDQSAGASNLVLTRNTTAPQVGGADMKIAKPASNEQGRCVFANFDISPSQVSKQNTLSFRYSASANFVYGASGDVLVFIADRTSSSILAWASSNALDGSGRFVAQYQAGANTTLQVILWIPVTTTLSWDLYVDKFSSNLNEGFMPVNVNQVFSAKVSSAGVVSDENSDWISGNCSVGGTSQYTCTFVTGMFATAPNCQMTPLNGTNAIVAQEFTAASVTSVVWYTARSDTTAATASAFRVSCQRAEPNPGFIVRMDQTNFGWTAYTPTFTGWGTVSTQNFRYSRDGGDLLIQGGFTAGTPTGVEARISLPTGLTATSTITNIEVVGDMAKDGNGSTIYALMETSGTYLTFGISYASGAGLTKALGSTIASAGQKLSFFARVPIQGWTQNQAAPLIVGGVTSSYNGTARTEVAKINCDAGSAIMSQQGSWVTSVGNVSTGACAVTLTSGIFSSTPYCTVTMNDSDFGATAFSLVAIPSSATAVSVDCYASGDCTNYDFNIECVGPR